MSILQQLRSRFEPALAAVAPNVRELLEMIRPAQDAKFGDYQANFAMSLGKTLGKPPREVAQQIVAQTTLGDLCASVEVAGPGFINLRLKDSWLEDRLKRAIGDERLGVEPVAQPRTYVVDYSSPNVAKPMHVGHIRSTVIGDALYKTLQFLGHKTISDNHLGDWGTQFGMIIYGYKHFLSQKDYKSSPLKELLRLYRLVNKLGDCNESLPKLPQAMAAVSAAQQECVNKSSTTFPAEKQDAKKATDEARRAALKLRDAVEDYASLANKVTSVIGDKDLTAVFDKHRGIDRFMLAETAKLHEGDEQNLKIWHEILPECRKAIQEIYDRLDVGFDHELGESFYHDQLAAVVEDFQKRGLAKESEGAMCVFLPGSDVPMIIRKKDGAFLYSTTDLATIKYRMEHWKPDAMLYVVDHRQGEHFDKLFAAARLWGYENIELQHISFGTILGDDGKPYKTRSGDTVGLEGLLDEAVSRALKVVNENDRDNSLPAEERQKIAEIVGIGALKYADLSQNRTSDYTFSYDKMLAMNGNTATYMQYSYVRVRGIFRKGDVQIEKLRGQAASLKLEHPAERALAVELLRFAEALEEVAADYRPNLLTTYLFELSKRYSTFFEECPVLKAETETSRTTRLLLCDLMARTIAKGLGLLGIQTVEKM